MNYDELLKIHGKSMDNEHEHGKKTWIILRKTWDFLDDSWEIYGNTTWACEL